MKLIAKLSGRIAIPKEYAKDKVFVTGIYGSGKTYFAKRYAAKQALVFISFDQCFDYAEYQGDQSKIILSRLPGSFIMDAIPFKGYALWDDFMGYEARHDVLVVCVYCPDYVQWLQRVLAKSDKRESHAALRGYLQTVGKLLGRSGRQHWTLNNETERMHLQAYRNFYSQKVHDLRKCRRVIFYDSLKSEFTTEEVMLERMRYHTFPLSDHLDRMMRNYDASYQDIEILNAVGYSESYRTWENIRRVVDCSGRRVIDLGCFHGYFSFKIEDRGGIVYGYDSHSAVLETARMINDLRGGRVTFQQWVSGEPVPRCDVVLCLNVLHHFGGSDVQEKTVAGMDCDTAIFEVNVDQTPLIRRYFQTLTFKKSHRQNRVIVVARNPHRLTV